MKNWHTAMRETDSQSLVPQFTPALQKSPPPAFIHE